MDLLGWIPLRWLVFAHVLAAVAFFAAHTPSVAAMLMLRRERELPAVRALLNMSRLASGWSWTAWALLAVTGALLATVEHTWSRPWAWGSIVVLLLVSGSMSPLAARGFNEARSAAGLAWFDGRGMQPERAADPHALGEALERIRRRAPVVMAIGVAGALVLVWLMAYKPS